MGLSAEAEELDVLSRASARSPVARAHVTWACATGLRAPARLRIDGEAAEPYLGRAGGAKILSASARGMPQAGGRSLGRPWRIRCNCMPLGDLSGAHGEAALSSAARRDNNSSAARRSGGEAAPRSPSSAVRPPKLNRRLRRRGPRSHAALARRKSGRVSPHSGAPRGEARRSPDDAREVESQRGRFSNSILEHDLKAKVQFGSEYRVPILMLLSFFLLVIRQAEAPYVQLHMCPHTVVPVQLHSQSS